MDISKIFSFLSQFLKGKKWYNESIITVKIFPKTNTCIQQVLTNILTSVFMTATISLKIFIKL